MRRKHHDLRLWQQAMQMVEDVCAFTRFFPREEAFNLTSQMRRAAVSVASNVAEGAARMTKKEFGHFLCVARGPLSELETQYLIACRIGLAQRNEQLEERVEEVFGLLGGLLRS